MMGMPRFRPASPKIDQDRRHGRIQVSTLSEKHRMQFLRLLWKGSSLLLTFSPSLGRAQPHTSGGCAPSMSLRTFHEAAHPVLR
eukprot:1156289-Pelagomonas_calceolata.AAC.3